MGVALPGIIATFHITPPEAGFLASSAFFGMFIGAIGISMLADRIGRKRALILAILGYSLFSAAAAFVQDYTSLVVVRIVEGLGLGAEVPLVYTFVSELVPVRRRGLLLTGSAFFWQGSNLVAALVAIVVIPWLSWRGCSSSARCRRCLSCPYGGGCRSRRVTSSTRDASPRPTRWCARSAPSARTR
jgi:MFS transporter, putative metabolite:H+ symporter